MEKFYIGAVLDERDLKIIEKFDYDQLKDEEFLRKNLDNRVDAEVINNVIRNVTDNLRKYGGFAISKNTFFAESNLDVGTKQTWWSLWRNHIAYIEKLMNKDLYQFSSREIINIIRTFSTSKYSRKDALFTFINQYMEWACYVRKLIAMNPCESIDRDNLIKVESNAVRASIVGLVEFYNMIDTMSKKTSWFNIAPLLLARYGICGKEFSYMINLKWTDIDSENMRVRIEYEKDGAKNEFYLPIDEKFLDTIDSIRDDYSPIGQGKKRALQVDNGYVLRNSSLAVDPTGKLENTMVYRRMQTAFKESGLPRLSVNSLVKSRRIDYLLEKRKERRLNSFDIQEAMMVFNPELTSVAYKPLKEEYEALTEVKNKKTEEIERDEVFHGKIKDHRLNDPNAVKYVQKLREDLGY